MTTMTSAQLAELITAHLAEHGLPEPVSLDLMVKAFDRQQVRVQLDTDGLTHTAAALLAWAGAQAAVTLEAWRPSEESVHLHLRSVLTGTNGTATLVVYGGVPFDATVFPSLEPGARQPVSLGQLTTWATGAEVAA